MVLDNLNRSSKPTANYRNIQDSLNKTAQAVRNDFATRASLVNESARSSRSTSTTFFPKPPVSPVSTRRAQGRGYRRSSHSPGHPYRLNPPTATRVSKGKEYLKDN